MMPYLVFAFAGWLSCVIAVALLVREYREHTKTLEMWSDTIAQWGSFIDETDAARANSPQLVTPTLKPAVPPDSHFTPADGPKA